jgi:type I restriction enzyme, R subunit
VSVVPRPYSEDAAVERPAIDLFGQLGWDHVNAYHERLGAESTLGRESRSQIFLEQRLRSALG